MLVKNKKDIKVLVVGAGGYAYICMMFNLGYSGAKTVEEADIVLFTGGEDVNPELYGEVCMHRTNFNRHRDEYEQRVYHRALDLGLPMVGICRGGQFLNVMNGGKMYQHVTNHCATHNAFVNVAPMNKGKRRVIEVTSTHHQMMIPGPDAVILLTALCATEKHTPGYTKSGLDKKDEDIEALVYTKTNCLCFQPHPEFGTAPPDCVDFFEECLDNWIVPMVEAPRNKKPIVVSAGKVK